MSNKDNDVPLRLMEAYDEVRESGRTNMFDATTVANIMIEMGYANEVIWLLRENDYSRVDTKKYALLLDAMSAHYVMAEVLTNDK